MTIDPVVRRQLGIRPGMVAYQQVVDGRLEVIFLPAPHRRSLYGALHRPTEPPQVTAPDQLEEAIMAAIAEQQGGGPATNG